MKDAITTTLEVVGLVLITYGISLVWVPGAFIFAGVGLFGISYFVVKPGGRK